MPSTLHVQLQLRIVSDDDTVIRDEVILQLDKTGDRLEAIGLCLEDSKDLLGRLQHAVVEAQAAAYVNRHRCCSACGRRLRRRVAWMHKIVTEEIQPKQYVSLQM